MQSQVSPSFVSEYFILLQTCDGVLQCFSTYLQFHSILTWMTCVIRERVHKEQRNRAQGYRAKISEPHTNNWNRIFSNNRIFTVCPCATCPWTVVKPTVTNRLERTSGSLYNKCGHDQNIQGDSHQASANPKHFLNTTKQIHICELFGRTQPSTYCLPNAQLQYLQSAGTSKSG